MTFPTVAASASPTTGVFASGDFTVTMPSGISAGDLLLVVIHHAVGSQRNYTAPTGWTEIGKTFANSEYESYVYAKIAVGGDTLTLARGAAGSSPVAFAHRITGAYADVSGVEVAFFNSFGTPTDPASLNPSGWGAEDTLWFAGIAVAGGLTVSGYPTNYSSNQQSAEQAGESHRCAMASRAVNAASEDPGAFTVSGATFGQMWTIAVRPAGAAGGGSSLLGGLTRSPLINGRCLQ